MLSTYLTIWIRLACEYNCPMVHGHGMLTILPGPVGLEHSTQGNGPKRHARTSSPHIAGGAAGKSSRASGALPSGGARLGISCWYAGSKTHPRMSGGPGFTSKGSTPTGQANGWAGRNGGCECTTAKRSRLAGRDREPARGRPPGTATPRWRGGQVYPDVWWR